ncbi:MAG: DUF3592 domain-containing protein [Clostridia bacterium]|nr:DUF3592 domain-containing protein [Clostridia bacterium]
MENIWVLYIVAAVMFLVGILVIVLDRRKRGRCTVQVPATVVDIVREVYKDDDGRKDISYRPVFEYFTGYTTIRTSPGTTSTRKRAYKIGEVYAIMFNPQKPEEFYVPGKSGATGTGIFLMVIALVLAGVAIYFGNK